MTELEIYGDIGADFFGQGITGAFVSGWLKANAKGKDQITVRINSVGGHVSEGSTIYSLLSNHPAKVVVHVDGFALSAASVIAMAADEIHMSSSALMMIHNASGGARGTAEDMEVAASALRKMSDTMAGLYASRTGKTKEECAALMAAETWFTAEEAKAAGLCDVVTPAKGTPTAADKSDWLATYRNVPPPVRMAAQGSITQLAPTARPKNTLASTPVGELARGVFGARFGD